MKYSLAAAASVLVAFAVPASAATIVQNVNIPLAPQAASNVTFNQFNSSLGTLISVSVLFDSDFEVSGSIENTSNASHTYKVNYDGSAVLSGNGININGPLANGFSNFTVGAGATVPINLVVGASNSDSQTLLAGLAPFIGAGTTFLTFTPSSSFSMTPNSGNLLTSPLFGGNVQITYDYRAAAVPEPATWGLMIVGFGVVGSTMRRRRATVGTLQRA